MSLINSVLFFLFLLCSSIIVAQSHELNGRIVDEATGEPLAYASVYFNATTNGTSTDLNGKFSISVDPDFTELVISFLGYNTIQFNLDIEQLGPIYKFEMTPESTELKEVEVKSTRGDAWFHNLKTFTKDFIGLSSNAEKTKIINPDVIQFDYDGPSGVLSASARQPLIIENKALGYIIEYDLESYIRDNTNKRVSFLGYSRFIEMEGSNRKVKKFIKTRSKVYKGSPQHFFRSLINRSIVADGFKIQKITKRPNLNRPSEEEILRAKTKVKALSEFGVSDIPDTVRNVLRRQSEPKFIAFLDKNELDYDQYIRDTLESSIIIAFSDQWQVTYTLESADKYYVAPGNLGYVKSNRPQVSLLTMSATETIINKSGIPLDPLAFLYEQYWGFVKVGDMLPVDYRLGEE